MDGSIPEWVSLKVQKKAKEKTFFKDFSGAKPFKYLFIPDFLVKKKAEALYKGLRKETFIEKQSDLFHLHQTQDLLGSEQAVLSDFFTLFSSIEFSGLIYDLTGVSVGKGVDMAGSLYKDGQYLLCHDDQLSGRKLAYIFYLSNNFGAKDGGGLVLFNSKNHTPTTVAHRYLPMWNSLMVFEVSPVSFHEVEENIGGKDRYAIGGWFH